MTRNIALNLSLANVCMALVVSATGCGANASGDVIVDPEFATGQETPSWDEFRAERSGSAVVGDSGDLFYNVEWDLWLSEPQLHEYYRRQYQDVEKAHVFTRYSNGKDLVYDRVKALHVRYCVSDEFGSDKARAVADVQAAMSAWETAANVHFDYQAGEDDDCEPAYDPDPPSNSAIDFAVYPAPGGPYRGCSVGAADAAWGSWDANTLPPGCPLTGLGGMLYHVLAISYAHIDEVNPSDHLDYITGGGVALHETGHVLGLRHEHPWNSGTGCGGEDQTLGTSVGGRQVGSLAYDQASVMHYPGICGKAAVDYEALSTTDGESIRELYGMPAAWYVPAVYGT